MEQIKHECGVALIRLRKPLQYYKEKYGTWRYGLDKLYLLMEKQHNRGQEAAGIGVVKLNAVPGHEYVYRQRALGSGAIDEIFAAVAEKLTPEVLDAPAGEVEAFAPYIGSIYMGHLRYSTTGKAGMEYVHPFLRRNNWRSRNLLMCGNFNLTNVDEVFDNIVAKGQHPRLFSDTVVLLEQLGYALDKENHRLYRRYRDTLRDPELGRVIEDNISPANVLRMAAPIWDGGYVICAATGSGDTMALRDPHGIRPAFYYADDEVVVVASERPVIQTVFNVPRSAVVELDPGCAVIVRRNGDMEVTRILDAEANSRCSFERIYFSRGSDADIYQERKALGRNLVPDILNVIGHRLDTTVFSFIPNTAEVAFIGMVEGLERYLDRRKMAQILMLEREGDLDHDRLAAIMKCKLRVEKIVLKDIKLRTFIAEGPSRNDLATHVYDVTYGCVVNDTDTLVVIDDSIVRGTTLRRSILRILDRLHPRHIVVVSSSPQVRYPDCYGIDMSRMSEFIAFRAAVGLLRDSGRDDLLRNVYDDCRHQLTLPPDQRVNAVKRIYEPFTDREISDRIALMLTDESIKADVTLVYQSVEGLHAAVPGHPGDWYFTGNYPTPGGVTMVNRAYINYYEGNPAKR